MVLPSSWALKKRFDSLIEADLLVFPSPWASVAELMAPDQNGLGVASD